MDFYTTRANEIIAERLAEAERGRLAAGARRRRSEAAAAPDRAGVVRRTVSARLASLVGS